MNGKGGSDINIAGSLEGADVHVPVGARQKARLTVADEAHGFSKPVVHELLGALGLLDDTTVPEVGEG